MKRKDDFEIRRLHLKELTEEQLEARFWELAGKVVDPLVELANKHTSPSIERSVLLRMGFSSLESTSIVNSAIERGLLEIGAGHLVYRLSKDYDMSIREAGMNLVQGRMWDKVINIFSGGEKNEIEA